jgi:hypothetical protein
VQEKAYAKAEIVRVNDDGTCVVHLENGLGEIEVLHSAVSLHCEDDRQATLAKVTTAKIFADGPLAGALATKRAPVTTGSVTAMAPSSDTSATDAAVGAAAGGRTGANFVTVRRKSTGNLATGLSGLRAGMGQVHERLGALPGELSSKVNKRWDAAIQVLSPGMQCHVECPYYEARIKAINRDATVVVQYTASRARDMRVPLAHIKPMPSGGAGRLGGGLSLERGMRLEDELEVAVGQTVMAKTAIPLAEYSAFCARLAACMTPHAFRANEIIVANGSKAAGMFLVDRGIVASAGSLFTKGKFFCTEGVLFEGTTDRQYRSVTNLTVMLVTKEAFQVLVLGAL